ncbi:DUF4089 domain-containing protein [Bosea sp. CS1GBMeth4]|uniref:DUF4089 domain-containing protein n=1 Tax=Bosea sp. CS1GBMeth4 TaxID=1892849 RepID=UPI0016489F61|nr:DUF4089 domain-containing protein [Bosea sp. CS1GBMeth4]
MSEAKQAFDPAAHLDAMAPALGLAITAEQREGVIRFLAAAEAMAKIVQAAPIAEDVLELAPVFRPGREVTA